MIQRSVKAACTHIKVNKNFGSLIERAPGTTDDKKETIVVVERNTMPSFGFLNLCQKPSQHLFRVSAVQNRIKGRKNILFVC